MARSLLGSLLVASMVTLLTPAAQAASGGELWVNRLDVLGASTFISFSIGVSPDGGILFVAGTGLDGLAVVAYDTATGDRVWTRSIDGAYTAGLAVAPDGAAVYVESTDVLKYFTMALEPATGARIWTAAYDGGGTNEPSSIALSPDGTKLFVTGTSTRENSANYDYATVSYDTATGQQLWSRRYDGPRRNDDGATSVIVSPDGTRVVVTGHSVGIGTGIDFATIGYDAASGRRLWLQRLVQFSDDIPNIPYAAAMDPEGTRVFVTGTSATEFATAAYDTETGTPLWDTYFAPGDRAFSIAVSPDGQRVYVAGDDDSFASYITEALDADSGARLWSNSYPGEKTTIAHALAVSPDGSRVFVTGEHTHQGQNGDYATVAYDAVSGLQMWASRYEGPAGGDDEALDVATSPDGQAVFVSGQSWGGFTGYDFATVAYEA
jgi:DNA-binding beta-propeller fold protein YncE